MLNEIEENYFDMLKTLTPFILLLSSIIANGQDSLKRKTGILAMDVFKHKDEKPLFGSVTAKAIDYLPLFLISDSALYSDVQGEEIKAKLEEFIRRSGYVPNQEFKSKDLKKIYKDIHDAFLKKYVDNPSFGELFVNGNYNCATATALYALLLDQLGIKYKIRETPVHVYIIAEPETLNMVFETTSPGSRPVEIGEKSKSQFVNYLFKNKLISKEEYNGGDKSALFEKHFYGDEVIDMKKMAGLLYYNAGIKAISEDDYREGYKNFEKAFYLYPDKKMTYLTSVCLGKIISEKGMLEDEKAYPYFLRFGEIAKEDNGMDALLEYMDKITEKLLLKSPDHQKYHAIYDAVSTSVTDSTTLSKLKYLHHYQTAHYYSIKNKVDSALIFLDSVYATNKNDLLIQELISNSIGEKMRRAIGNEDSAVNELNRYFTKYAFIDKTDKLGEFYTYCLSTVMSKRFKKNDAKDGDKYLGMINGLLAEQPGLVLKVQPYVVPGFLEVYYYQLRQKQYKEANAGSAADPFATINKAISAASPGEIIYVDAGSYIENVLVNKSLKIYGTNYNISPNGGSRVSESVVQPLVPGQRAFEASTSGVTAEVKGFKIINGSPLHSGNAQRNPANPQNIVVVFENNIVNHGTNLFSGSLTRWLNVTIVNNLFQDIDGVASNGTFTSSAIQFNNATNAIVTIADNVINTTSFAGILLYGVAYASVERNIISNVKSEGIQLAFFIGEAVIMNNEITNANSFGESDNGGIRIWGSEFAGPITVKNNKIVNSFNGFAIKNGEDISGKTIELHENAFDNNINKAVYHDGTGSLSAGCNWLGSACDVSSTVSGPANYSPWLISGVDFNSATGFQTDLLATCKGTELSVSASGGSIACNGGTTTVTVDAIGGSGSLTYSLNGVDYQPGNIFTNVPAGTYNSISVKDGSGCSKVVAPGITISQPAAIIASASAGVIACNGGTTLVTVDASGGSGSFIYSLNGVDYQVSNIFQNVPAGTYNSITVKDANGCIKVVTPGITVSQPSALIASAASGSIACNGGTTNITITASGGTGTLAYALDGVGYQASNVFQSVPAGTYNSITVKDANGCLKLITPGITISEPFAISASAAAGSIACNGGTTNITITASGGTGTLAYALDGVGYQASNVFQNVPAGTYSSITVKDANGCLKVLTPGITISQPSAITASAAAGNILCNGGTTSITITAAGGTGTLSYALNGVNYQASNIFQNVPAGTYNSITVKDANGCLKVITPGMIISQPSAITASATAGPILCNTSVTTVAVTANGGTGTFTYSLDGTNFQASNTFTNVPAGTYNAITAKDANGCIKTAAPLVIAPPSSVFSVAPESYPTQYNTGLSKPISNKTFSGSSGIWTANSTGNATIAVLKPYYSPSSSYALKIVNHSTKGLGAATATATSPQLNLSNACCPTEVKLNFTLWTYAVKENDTKASFKIDFSSNNGSTWTEVWSQTSGQLYTNLKSGGKANISILVPVAYQKPTFRYRFRGEMASNDYNNFYLFVDDINFTSPAVCTPNLSIGDLVWNDNNFNGVKDLAETGISGATVRLYKDDNNDNIANTSVFATKTTDANGLYSFGNLAPGNYIVGVVLPGGYTASSVNGGDPDNNVNNDNNGVVAASGEVRSLSLTLSLAGEPDNDGDDKNGNKTVDFGLFNVALCTKSKEIYPNQFNTGLSKSLNNVSFQGASGTWKATSNANASLAVIKPYYSATTYGLKLANFKTKGLGSGTCSATSPQVSLANACCPDELKINFTLWSYVVVSGDTKAALKIDFSSNNGSTWTEVLHKIGPAVADAVIAEGCEIIMPGVITFKQPFASFTVIEL